MLQAMDSKRHSSQHCENLLLHDINWLTAEIHQARMARHVGGAELGFPPATQSPSLTMHAYCVLPNDNAVGYVGFGRVGYINCYWIN